MKIDFGLTAHDYAKHRAGFPPDLFARLAAFGIGLPGQRILDLGTGTGSLARGFALRGSRVTGLDPSGALLEQARMLDEQAGVQVGQVMATAEDTGLPDAHFDVVAAGQCWHWFDRSRAAQEARRLLVRGGVLLMAHFDWLPLPGNVVDATEQLILKHNPQWTAFGGKGIHAKWFADLSLAGFEGLESFSFDVDVPYTQDGWRGRIRASAGVAASLAADAVAAFDAEHAQLLRERCGEGGIVHAPHRVFAVWGRHFGGT